MSVVQQDQLQWGGWESDFGIEGGSTKLLVHYKQN